MENHFDKRLDPRLLVPGAKTLISLLYNYYPEEKQNLEAPQIAKYAYGKDYHIVVKEKAKLLYDFILQNIGEIDGRVFVDSAPVLEKAWAKRAGIGWIGKNSNLLTKSGSFYFLAELIIDLELVYNTQRIEDYCGTCKRCIIACPTKAIVKPGVIDGNRCISYLTIENKGEIPIEFKGKMSNTIFGCDICQDVCPWNYRMQEHNEPEFKASTLLLTMNKDDWNKLDETTYQQVFKNSAVKRTKFSGLKRNIDFLKDSD
jgi:epoxyqueuosine reductase